MVFIIAEIGTNHMGDLKIAKKLIEVASKAGCDAVKFQKKNVEKIYNKEFLDSYLESPWGTTQREMRLHREFNDKQFQEIVVDHAVPQFDGTIAVWHTCKFLSMPSHATNRVKQYLSIQPFEQSA